MKLLATILRLVNVVWEDEEPNTIRNLVLGNLKLSCLGSLLLGLIIIISQFILFNAPN